MPNGLLYEEGVAQRIREELLTDFNLHTVIRLPKGVFEPYTDISTNILFFDRGMPSSDIWFYEHPLPERRSHLKGKSYSATDGIEYEEFESLFTWWPNRSENENAWKVSKLTLRSGVIDLAQNHPKHARFDSSSPNTIIGNVRKLKNESEDILISLEESIDKLRSISAPEVRLGDLLSQRVGTISLVDDDQYKRPRVGLHFKGARVRDVAMGIDIGTKNQTLIRTNDLILSKIDARNGAMALVPSELDGAIATNDFPVFEIDSLRINPSYLRYCLFQPSMIRVYENLSRGSTNRRRLKVDKFLDLTIPLPESIEIQIEVADALKSSELQIAALQERFGGMEEELKELIGSALHNVFSTSH